MTSAEVLPAGLFSDELISGKSKPIVLKKDTVQHNDTLFAHVDIELGKRVENIGFIDSIVLARLREEGFTEEQIADLEIYISAERVAVDDDETDTYGRYHSKKNGSGKIVIYLGPYLPRQERMEEKYAEDDREALGYLAVNLSSDVTEYQSATLYHEIRHAKHRVVEQRTDWHKRKLLARYAAVGIGVYSAGIVAGNSAISMTGLGESTAANISLSAIVGVGSLYTGALAGKKSLINSQKKGYMKNPEEKDAFAAEEDTQTGAFYVFFNNTGDGMANIQQLAEYVQQ